MRVERALYRALLEWGALCMSQASMRTGYGISALENACLSLERRGLITVDVPEGAAPEFARLVAI